MIAYKLTFFLEICNKCNLNFNYDGLLGNYLESFDHLM